MTLNEEVRWVNRRLYAILIACGLLALLVLVKS